MPTHSSTVRGALLGTKLLAVALSLAVLIGSGWAWATYRNFTSSIPQIPIAAEPNRADPDGKDQNILLVGTDDRQTASPNELAQLGTTEDGGTLNTDTMMLMHLPADGRKASVISFPRDTYVAIPGHTKQKLNAAYSLGIQDGHGSKAQGAALLRDTIENLTGLKIDHFVTVDLIGFYRISNAIGGVDLCLNEDARPARSPAEALADIPGVDGGEEPNGNITLSYTQINLHKGINRNVKGQQALAFVRQRHGLPGGDLDRIRRQQVFLSAVFRKLYSEGTITNPLKIQRLLKAIASSISMDTALTKNPLQLASQLQNLTAGNLSFVPIPLLPGSPTVPGVGDVLMPDTAAIPGFIQTLIGHSPTDPISTAKPADPHTVSVTVVNDANGSGLDQTNAAALRKLGFTVTIPPATSDVLDKTTITYPPGSEAAAKAVAAAVPGALLGSSKTVHAVTLALGNNGIQVKSLMTGKPTASATSSTPPIITAAQASCVN